MIPITEAITIVVIVSVITMITITGAITIMVIVSVITMITITGTITIMVIISVITMIISGAIVIFIRDFRFFVNTIDNFLLLFRPSHVISYDNFIGIVFIYIDIIRFLPCISTVKRVSLFRQPTTISIICRHRNTDCLRIQSLLFNGLNGWRIAIDICYLHTTLLCISKVIICNNLIFSGRHRIGIKVHLFLILLIRFKAKYFFTFCFFYLNLIQPRTTVTDIYMNAFFFCPDSFFDYNLLSDIQCRYL